jgi:hypothetical protein
MALRKSVILDNGLEASDAYCVIESITVSATNRAVGVIRFYKDQKAFIAGRPAFQEQLFDFVYDGADLFESAYSRIKTHPDFIGAIDC